MSWKQDLISVQVLVPGEGKMGKMYLNGTKTVKRVIRTTVIMLTMFLMPVFADTDDSVPVSSGLAIMHEEEFGGVYLGLTIEEFNSLGYAYGDSVTVRFSNGYELPGIPYYNGFYAQNGDALLVAYPGYPYIKACIQTGDDLWVMAGLKEGDTAEASLAVRGEYLDIQTARNIHYEDDRTLFASDSVFANFRSIIAGDIQENYLYRSASPCDNQHNRAPFADGLIAEAGVNHNNDLETALRLCDAAKEAGADVIKFQTWITEKLITRHKNVINGIFKGAGLQKQIIDDKNDKENEKVEKGRKIKSVSKGRIQNYLDIVKEVDKMDQENINEEDFENYDDEFLTTSVSELNGVFYKLKKINQIKDNLSNIQDDCLGYHEKLRDTLKRSQSARPQNRKDIKENKEEQKI